MTAFLNLILFSACPDGRFGTECKEKCKCAPNQQCDPINGKCFCRSGFQGPNCTKSMYFLQNIVLYSHITSFNIIIVIAWILKENNK